ncbi:MAG: polysaccharide pyruvyl transferase family protein [Proteobacteria bacterium]|nr:polysaccharide pyruvyl transferase family protein [Pseudomonadota bacterium]MBU1388560.1 polysaccharide pyruvyl transferase family protein [Pseudomonadota bacterium]MBU1544362.1 polysaccharide pyruvyl transferase family protein [Pseudomonadota bacterium]
MKRKCKKILVLADVSGMCEGYHVGDEAMAEVAISRLSDIFGRQNIVLFCSSPETAAKTYGVKAVALYSRTDQQRKKALLTRPHSVITEFVKVIIHLIRCDLVFVSGGGNHTSVWPHVLESRLYYYRLANFFRKPLVFSSQTLGPFSKTHREMCQKTFRHSAWVGVRDKEYSAKQLDIPVHFAVDDAVYLSTFHDEQTQKIADEHKKLLGISLRNFQGVTHEHHEKLCRFLAIYARKANLSTVFIPHHAANNMGDLDIARRVSHVWDAEAPFLLLEPVPHASAVKALTQNCSLVVTMRYHQVVFSLSVGVPTIGIYVEEYTRAKLNGAFEQFGLKPLLFSINDTVHNNLESLIEEALQLKDVFKNAASVVGSASLEDNMKPYFKAREITNEAKK